MIKFIFLSFFVILTIVAVNRAHDLRRGCVSFGKTYKNGESFILSTGDNGYLVTYVCVDGTWNSSGGAGKV